MVVFELDSGFFETFIKGIPIKGIGFDMIFCVNASKMHKVVGTESHFNKSGLIIAVSVNKCKLSVTKVAVYRVAHLLMMDIAYFLVIGILSPIVM